MIRAMHEWIVDSGLTPYALVETNHDNVVVPTEFIEDNKILLNVSPNATQNLNLGNEYILFHARFNGVSMEVSFPIDAVMAIYAKENGRGMMFKEDDLTSDSSVVDSKETNSIPAQSGPVGVDSAVLDDKSSESDSPDKDDPDPDNNGPSGTQPPKKPTLKIVK